MAPHERPVSETQYDEFPYDELAIAETHPERMAAMAKLLGLKPEPAPATTCRVLELGCGIGGNLIPMACELPEAKFLGVDLSARQIEIGQRTVDALGLTNIELRAADILDLGPSLGKFDYILCHGVYSWVPREVQTRILELCGECLAEGGVAYISFNTYPGWHLRGAVRDMLRREVGEHGTPQERVRRARDFLKLFRALPENGNAAQRWLKVEVDLLDRLSDQYLFFEHLVDINLPCYFTEFVQNAAQAGLQYLSDADFASMVPAYHGKEIATAVEARAENALETEQYLDLLDMRYFRRTLLCRSGAAIDRHISWERMRGLRVLSKFQPVGGPVDLHSEMPQTFQRPNGTEISTSAPLLKAALCVLAEQWPRGLAFEPLCDLARARLDGNSTAVASEEEQSEIGGNLLGLLLNNQLELGTWAPPYEKSAGDRPETAALVRLQAQRGHDTCTTFRLERVGMDRFDRAVLRRMDGTRTREELVDGVIEDIDAGLVVLKVDDVPTRDREVIREVLEQKLANFARVALIRR